MDTLARPPTSTLLTTSFATSLGSSFPRVYHIASSRRSSGFIHCSSNYATVIANTAQNWPVLLHEYGPLLGSVVPVGVAVLGCKIMGVRAQKEITVSVTRCSIQLLVLAFTLKFVFDGERIMASILAVSFMVLVAGYTAGNRARDLPQSHVIATSSLAIGTLGVLATMVLLNVCPLTPRYIVPTAGYVIGNTMSIVGTAMHGLKRDIIHHRGQIETALALGAKPDQAVVRYLRRAVTQAMTPWIDSIKAAGLITIPGSMTGMLMVGMRPIEVVQIQLQLLYMLLGASAVSTALSAYFGSTVLFSKTLQLDFESS